MHERAIDFPLRLDEAGSAAPAATRAEAVEQLIEELLFTAPGERLNRPSLGCGLLEMVFAPAGDEMRAAAQFQVATELQRWLGDVIRVGSVTVSGGGEDGQLLIGVEYQLLADGSARRAAFRR